MITMKSFPLDHVLSITTGRLCCDMDGVYELLNHVTGDNLFTHVLPRACRFAAPLILEQHSELATASTAEAMQQMDNAIAGAKTASEGVDAWLAALPLKPEYDIESHADKWLSRNPIEELEGMVGKERMLVTEA